MKRRDFLRATAAVCVVAAAGPLIPRKVLAAWPEAAFHATEYKDALNKLLGDVAMAEGGIELTTPEGQADGAAVVLTISSKLPNVSSIVIVSEPNPAPLIARFNVLPGTRPYLKTRIKMGGSGKVIILVKADGKFHKVEKAVKVSAGACA